MPDYAKVFSEIHRVLKRNAFFIFNFPNLLSVMLPAGVLVNIKQKSLINPVFTRWYTLKNIKNALFDAGFKLDSVEGGILPDVNMIPFELTKIGNKFLENNILKNIGVDIFVKAVA